MKDFIPTTIMIILVVGFYLVVKKLLVLYVAY